MASSARDKDDAASSLPDLKLEGSKGAPKPPKAKKNKEVLDSWEDQDELSSEDEVKTPLPRAEASSPAPPAPKSPQFSSPHGWNPDAEPAVSASPGGGDGGPQTRRPEKTDAVARRMIAAGLGLKAPKQTEEQRAYQKSVREQEKRRKEQEKAEEQRRRDDADKARAAIWDD
ncbi:hypothetical protein HRG_003894 [Hirsutella rhossiliensis]|uniref:Ubiquitin-like protein smt3 n=1 Tax=Hirsutella rhossiliensis TaxID=111463 RepID=A0A9P8N1E0_9HYPO|nr:uncharacterized protein HRG_03894 [Hirsutella rhossiliensis]KAH0965878.1 hypothetical protein HRG_03894 [Hirsutella rhossiliensis]